MVLQDINLITQNQHILPAQASNGIYIHAQESEAIVTEAMSDADGEVVMNPANDPVFSNTTFPPITTLHGI